MERILQEKPLEKWELIERIRVNPMLYGYLNTLSCFSQTYQGSKIDLMLVYSLYGVDVPIEKDESLRLSWVIDYKQPKPKELDKMLIPLKDVTFQGVLVGNATQIELANNETLTIKPQGADVFKLLGALQVLRSQKDIRLQDIALKVEGTHKEAPWLSYTIDGYIREYSTDCQHNYVQGVSYIRMHLRNVTEHINRDKLPKVDVKLSSEEAAYLQALVLADIQKAGKNEARRSIIETLRAASKEGNE
jgi:hypothetical protein